MCDADDTFVTYNRGTLKHPDKNKEDGSQLTDKCI